MAPTRLIRAAGAVVWRHGSHEPEVVLVHRPRYGDWSLPKGKLDQGELSPVAAVREVREETGLQVALGVPLPEQRYEVGASDAEPRPKVVNYWAARAGDDSDLSRFEPNDEVSDARWVSISSALRKLSYPHDVQLVRRFAKAAYASSPLVLVRHAEAQSRKAWKGDDSERTLNDDGYAQTEHITALLQVYAIRRVVSSDAVRCVDSVLPFANASGARMRLDPALSEAAADPRRIHRRLGKALAGSKRVAYCSHRPVLPEMYAALGLDPIAMSPADVVVLHRAKGKIVATEHHRPE